MAEFSFYCLQQDWRGLLQRILEENNLRFALDDWYESLACPTYSVIDDIILEKLELGKRRIYLIGDFTVGKPYMSKQDEGPKAGFYSINIAYAGPIISLSLPASYEEGGITRVSDGNLYYPSQYWDANITHATAAGAGVKAAFTAVRKTLQTEFVSAEIVEPVWISKSALKLVRQGNATLMVNGRWEPGGERIH